MHSGLSEEMHSWPHPGMHMSIGCEENKRAQPDLKSTQNQAISAIRQKIQQKSALEKGAAVHAPTQIRTGDLRGVNSTL